MADSLDGWIARRLESYARKHGLECDIAEPGKLIQVHKWLTFESPYWARVGDSELSILAVFSEESALKYQTQTGRSITSLRRAVLRLTSIRPTLILPFAKAQTRDLAFDVLAFTVMNSGGEHEPVYYDRVKDTSREINRGQLRDWVDGLKRKYNQIGLRPIPTSPTTDSVEPYPSTRPAPTLIQPSSSIGSSANTSLPPPPHASSLPSYSANPSESEPPPKTKPKNILDLSWWIIPPDQQILLDAIDEPSRPRLSPSWHSDSSHPVQLSRAISPPSSVPEKIIPPITTTDPPIVDQDSEEELSIRKPRVIGTNAGTVKGSLLHPVRQIPSAPETAPHTEPVVPSLATPPPPKSAPSTPVSAEINVATIMTVNANNDTEMIQNETDVAHPKVPEREKSLLASQSQTITHSSPSSTRPSLPPSLSQPQSQFRSPSQQHGSPSIPPRLSSTAPLQHTVVLPSDKPDGISRTTEAQDGTKRPLGRASSTVLVPNSDTDSLSRSQSLPLSWPPTEPSSSQPSQARPLDQPQSLSPPRPSTQPSVSGSQTQSLSQTQTQTQSPSQPTEKPVPPISHPPLVQVPDRIVSTSEMTVESIPTITAVESALIPTVTNVNSRKRPVLDEFLTTHNEQKRPKTAEPTTEPNFGQDQNQNQPDKQAAATTAAVAATTTTTTATTTSSKTWSTVPMLRTGQPTYTDQPLDSQPTQTRGAETIEFSQMPDTQQRETVRAALAQGKSSFPQSSETAAATGSLQPLVPLSVAVDRHNGKNKDSEQTSGGGGSIKKSAPARIVADTSSLQSRSSERSPAPATTPTATFTPTSVPVTLPTLASTSAPTPAPVPVHDPVPPLTRPTRKVFKLQRTLPLAPGLPSETDVLALLREAKRWASSKQTDQTVEKRSG
ncbi:hypothetical protein [Phaffia rhodozyma]|uniref:Uncharacterized protein n=1 Tax=Phaffia rhodozyma TaxID=264483 RepID=A0A0F7SFN2_PHARH|nr:hypothetical protein [Phaffia rhodozyma]